MENAAGPTRSLRLALLLCALPRGAHRRIFGAHSPDVDFLLALIDRLAAEGLVDPARVFVNGYSGGAQMSWRFACQMPARRPRR